MQLPEDLTNNQQPKTDNPLQRLSSVKPVLDFVPVTDLVLTHPLTEIDLSTFAEVREID